MEQTKLTVVPRPTEEPYKFLLATSERRAFRAAWKIMQTDFTDDKSGTPSGHHSRRVERMARIIYEEMTTGRERGDWSGV